MEKIFIICHKTDFSLVIISESTIRTVAALQFEKGAEKMRDGRACVKFIEKCYKLYEQKMYQIAYSILRDKGLAEDAVHEAFLKLMKSGMYFEDAKSDDCKRYLITVIKHASITAYNKKQREQEIMYLSDKDELLEEQDFPGESEDDDSFEDLISDLPPKYYAVVNCLAVRNLSYEETAKEFHITEQNVRKRFERAKIMLKTILKGGRQYESKIS